MESPENASLVDIQFLVKGANTSAMEQRFESLVDSGELVSSLNDAGLEVKGICFFSRPRFVNLQDCGDKNMSIGKTCDDSNRDNLDACDANVCLGSCVSCAAGKFNKFNESIYFF